MIVETQTHNPPHEAVPKAIIEKASFVLEQGKRLSESIIWQLGRQYYSNQGPAAWESGTVPFYATSNPFIAQCYAQVVLSYLRDCMRGQHLGSGCAIVPDQPIYIVELAAGSGRFSALFLKQFFALKNASSLKSLDIRFVMTDFTETNLRGWMAQPQLQPYLEAGVLDFSLFNMEESDRFKLLRSGAVLAPGTIKNPLTVLCTYAFDSATQDVFRFTAGTSAEGLLTTSSRKPVATGDAALLPKLNLQFAYQPFDGAYYGRPDFDQILEYYRANLIAATVLFPLGPLRCIERLIDIAQGKLLLLSSDIGYTHEDELASMSEEARLRFYGGPATQVNFHAIGQYFKNRGGHMAAVAERLINLKTAAFLLGGPAEQFADTLGTFAEYMDRFGPHNFHTFMANLRQSTENVTLELFLDLLRISFWDPKVFMGYRNQLAAQLHFVAKPTYLALRSALGKVWANFHPIDGDLPFELARLYLAMHEPVEAIRFGELSRELFGDHPATWYNLGLCHYKAGDFTAAMHCFEHALKQRPGYARALLWRAHALAEMAIPPEFFLPTAEKDD